MGLSAFERQLMYNEHRQRVRNAKSIVDSKPPQRRPDDQFLRKNLTYVELFAKLKSTVQAHSDARTFTKSPNLAVPQRSQSFIAETTLQRKLQPLPPMLKHSKPLQLYQLPQQLQQQQQQQHKQPQTELMGLRQLQCPECYLKQERFGKAKLVPKKVDYLHRRSQSFIIDRSANKSAYLQTKAIRTQPQQPQQQQYQQQPQSARLKREKITAVPPPPSPQPPSNKVPLQKVQSIFKPSQPNQMLNRKPSQLLRGQHYARWGENKNEDKVTVKKSSGLICDIPEPVIKRFEYLVSSSNRTVLRKLLRPRIYFDLEVKNVRPLGRIVIQLFTEACPEVVFEFVRVCTAQRKERLNITRLFTPLWCEGELLLDDNRTLTSANIEHDMSVLDHGSSAGILSFPSRYVRGSKRRALNFSISFKPLTVLNGKRIAFGRVRRGYSVLETIQDFQTKNGKPLKEIVVGQCGMLKT